MGWQAAIPSFVELLFGRRGQEYGRATLVSGIARQDIHPKADEQGYYATKSKWAISIRVTTVGATMKVCELSVTFCQFQVIISRLAM
jgi:hypothetical protein